MLSQTTIRRLQIVVVLNVVILLFLIWPRFSNVPTRIVEWTKTATGRTKIGPRPEHIIDKFIHEAEVAYNEKLSRQTFNLSTAAAAYRERRGRHPPPGFDAWWKFAMEKEVVMVEDFWDQIYNDLNPFWGYEPAEIRLMSRENHEKAGEHTIRIRNGKAGYDGDWFWTIIWTDLMNKLLSQTRDDFMLPDLNIRTNTMDESRLSIPWEDINSLMQKMQSTKKTPPANEVISEFSKDADVDKWDDKETEWEKSGMTKCSGCSDKADVYYSLILRTCPPGSPAREYNVTSDFKLPPHIWLDSARPHMQDGYVRNYTLSTLICHQPDILDLNMAMIHPSSTRAGKKLIPLFGGSKLSCNSEILLPAALYWKDDERYAGKASSKNWKSKPDKVIWRGLASGGIYGADTWTHQHRLRFMAYSNATQVDKVENGELDPLNWVPPDPIYKLSAQHHNDIGRWAAEWSDTGFTELNCQSWDHGCPYLQPYFNEVSSMPFSDVLSVKYLPDIDGQSFSGRFRAYLQSYSLPIKATMYREWHDSRLFAWKHFVPMDNRFTDFYGIMEYFLGYSHPEDKDKKYAVLGHDDVASEIAKEGREWAAKVLRKEDMLVYVYRLLLEYARVLDDKRDVLGWAGDL